MDKKQLENYCETLQSAARMVNYNGQSRMAADLEKLMEFLKKEYGATLQTN